MYYILLIILALVLLWFFMNSAHTKKGECGCGGLKTSDTLM